LGRDTPVLPALFAALVYAIHPAMMETAAWISGRFDLMVTFFTLSAMWVYLSDGKNLAKALLVSLLIFLSLLCKETGTMFLVAMPCIWMATRASSGKESHKDTCYRAWRENRWIFPGILAILAFRFFLLTQNINMDHAEYFENEIPWYSRVILFLETLKFYLLQAAFPVDTSVMHPIGELSFSSASGNMVILILLVWICLYKRSRTIWIFMAGLVYLLPVLNILPIRISGNIGHERFLTTPLAFWTITLSLARYDLLLSHPLVRRFFASTRFLPGHILIGGLIGIWMLIMAFTTYSLTSFWKNDLMLWSWTYDLYPDNDYTHHRYIESALIAGHPDLVEKDVLKILEKPGNKGLDISMQYYYGLVLLMKKDPESLNCLKGLVESIQDFHIHEFPDSLKRRNQISFEKSEIISSTYMHYANAVLFFERDPQKAMTMNEIGKWYNKNSSVAKMLHYQYMEIAYLYALGRFEEGETLFLSLPSDKEWEARNFIDEILSYHCRDAIPEYCNKIFERGWAKKRGTAEGNAFLISV
jgi:hypothetical protein